MAGRRRSFQGPGPKAQALIRIIIASYFLAGALGYFEGVSIVPLFAAALPEAIAWPAATAAILVLSAMILSGHWLRPAALLLSIALFWSSYLEMLALGVAGQLGQFWRDLALVGALLLTYAETGDGRRGPVALFGRKPQPPWRLGRSVSPRRVGIERDRTNAPLRLPRKKPVAVPVPGPQPVFASVRGLPRIGHPDTTPAEETENIFRTSGRRVG